LRALAEWLVEREVEEDELPVPRHQVFPTSPRRQVTGEAPPDRSGGICLYFDRPTESDAAPLTLNLLNINHIAERQRWN
jgi:hypothetical protein